MRVLLVILVSAAIGLTVGAALAYVEVRPGGRGVTANDLDSGSDFLKPLPGAKEARVEVDELEYDFGTMQQGATQSHVFVLRNVGQAPLTLESGPTSCKCTLSDVSEKPVPPGESVPVKLEWTAKTGVGPMRQRATILTNDLLHSRLELVVTGTVTEPTGVFPAQVLLDKIASGETKSAEVIVMAMSQDTLEVSDPQLSDPRTREFFDVRIEPLARESLPDPTARQGVRVIITAKKGLPMGRIEQWLSLKTNMPDAEKLDIPVIGRVVGDVRVYGRLWNDNQGVLRLGRVRSDEGAGADLNIVVRNEKVEDVKVEVASCDPPELEVTLGEPRQIKEALVHVPLRIEVPPGTRPMVRLSQSENNEGRVILKTSLSDAPELVLGVRFAVER